MTDGEKLNERTLRFDEMEFKRITPRTFYQSEMLQQRAAFTLSLTLC